MAGCAGSSGTPAGTQPAQTRRALFQIAWPARPSDTSRLVPAAANSVQVTILSGTTVVSSQLAVRPAAGGSTTVTFDSLPVGAFTVSAAAYPQADGTGTVLATATAPLSLFSAQTTQFSLTLQSTIDHLELSVPATTVNAGTTMQVGVTAKDATGAIVLLTPSKLAWNSSNTSVASVDGSGNVGGLFAGATSISVQDSESNKSASAVITVLLTVAVQPQTATVTLSDPVPLAAAVVGSANTNVTWRVVESDGGSITTGGVYTAPDHPGTFHVVATSDADPTRADTATITVQAGSASGTVQ
jgi:hypothetical protein